MRSLKNGEMTKMKRMTRTKVALYRTLSINLISGWETIMKKGNSD
jgi:hypothetical protein